MMSSDSVFNNYPRETTVTWSEVPGAVAYVVEWESLQCGRCKVWVSQMESPPKKIRTVKPTATFSFVGMQLGRWRVLALDAKGSAGPASEWREFRYTR
jgi:hypothetical protein